MKFIQTSPVRLEVTDASETELKHLKTSLTFLNKANAFEYKKFKKNIWYANKYGREEYLEKLEELKNNQNVCLLYEDADGFYTLPGIAKELLSRFPKSTFENQVDYPGECLTPWKKMPSKSLRPYQQQAVSGLIAAKHGAVELATGLGKSLIILHIAKSLGLKTVVMAPTTSIFSQLLKDFKEAFGERYVGAYGDGKKRSDKLFTIGIAQSLTRIEEGSEDWNNFRDTKVFIADESHLTPAKTLEYVCHSVFAKSPYRFFFSGTQMRGDGADLLLRGITGGIVQSMDVKQGVAEGWLARLDCTLVKVPSHSLQRPNDILKMAKVHFLYNKEISNRAVDIANRSVSLLGHQVLILIDEIEQFFYLYPGLKHEVGFAHGGNLSVANKAKIPEKFHKSDPEELVERFNNGDLRILIGTSCINTGTDIRPVKTFINLQGGISEVQLKQSVGRCTRVTKDKKRCNVVDFIVEIDPDNDRTLNPITRHCLVRKSLYEEICESVTVING